jgi:hypothetical protein
VAGRRRAAALWVAGEIVKWFRERLLFCVGWLDVRDVNALEIRYHWLEMDRRLLELGQILISYRVKQCLVFFAFQECLVFFT